MGRLSTTECTYLPTYLYVGELHVGSTLSFENVFACLCHCASTLIEVFGVQSMYHGRE